MHITIGSWGIPLLASAAAFGVAAWKAGQHRPQGDYDFGGALVSGFCMAAATIVSLAVWLVWALVR